MKYRRMKGLTIFRYSSDEGCVCVCQLLSCVRIFGPVDCSLHAPCPWISQGKNIAVSGHSLLQGIFLTQGLNPGLLHWGRVTWETRLMALQRHNIFRQPIKYKRINILNTGVVSFMHFPLFYRQEMEVTCGSCDGKRFKSQLNTCATAPVTP